MSLATRFDYENTEKKIQNLWQENKASQSAINSDGQVLDDKRSKNETFVIAIPPPNVTGRLHMGHALNNSIQDMLTRYMRMDGKDALWVPGTDHAGIATQTVVKKMLDAEGIDYRELGREAFVEKVWEWKEKYGGLIVDQLARLGASCDWERQRFTMDEGLSKAVNFAFKKLYDDGLVYRGKRIVNWCPVDRTALSDDEIETKEGGEPGFLWHILYPMENGEEKLQIATTRPETLFGDTALAVHPEDERYRHLVGKKVKVPVQGRLIPIIADEYVDREFGTGVVKITPAHDPNDFEVGQRHELEAINIMHEDASMNEVVPEEYRGLSREKARKQVVEALKSLDLLVKEEARMTPVGRSYRSKAIIEYRLSEQWFVKMQPLADKVLAKHDELNIQPKRWDKVYLKWLHEIRDWCISRQIWWGHRIPAWYHKTTGEILVEEQTPKRVLEAPDDWRREEDVLDTWFSSALWPMSILGWPERSIDFERYFPTTTLSTAKDIIFFWVARMNIMAVYFEGKLPYTNVFIHPTVMDEKGETMSKSKGNGIDPLHIINGASMNDLKAPIMDARPSNMDNLIARIEKNYPEGFPGVGADALRYTLIYLCSSGQELKISLDSFLEIGRRFMTKLWNASRLFLSNLESLSEHPQNKEPFVPYHESEDIWIQSRLCLSVKKIRKAIENYDFYTLGPLYYDFVWNDFCDWYLEILKPRLNSENITERKNALYQVIYTFSGMLRMLHPLIPYITEDLWQSTKNMSKAYELWIEEDKNDLLMLSAFPEGDELTGEQEQIVDDFEHIRKIVSEIRSVRTTQNIKDKEVVDCYIKAADMNGDMLLSQSHDILCRLAGLNSIKDGRDKPEHCTSIILPDFEIYLDLSAFVDHKAELLRMQKELKKKKDDIAFVDKKLSNQRFVENAKAEIVEKERQKHQDLLAGVEKIEAQIQQLERLLG